MPGVVRRLVGAALAVWWHAFQAVAPLSFFLCVLKSHGCICAGTAPHLSSVLKEEPTTIVYCVLWYVCFDDVQGNVL